VSAIKAWQADVRLARKGAREAAYGPTACARMESLRTLFASLGEAAGGYAEPRTAALGLVREAVKEYQLIRRVERALTNV